MIGQLHFCSRMTVPTPLLKGNYWWGNTDLSLVWRASASSINSSLSSHNWSCTEELFSSVTDERFCRSVAFHVMVKPILLGNPFLRDWGRGREKGWKAGESEKRKENLLKFLELRLETRLFRISNGIPLGFH